MARMITGSTSMPITRKQLRSLLNETTAITSDTSTGSGMEYVLTMLGDDRVVVIVSDAANTEHAMIIDRITYLEMKRRQKVRAQGADNALYALKEKASEMRDQARADHALISERRSRGEDVDHADSLDLLDGSIDILSWMIGEIERKRADVEKGAMN